MKMEVAALVMGIIGLVCNFFGTGTIVGPICSVLAIIFGVIGMKKNTDKRGMAKAGMIMGVIGLCLGIIITIACVACIGAGAAALASFPSFWDMLNSL